MRIVILGAGVIGVATAWELLRDGHEVVVVDREEGPAMLTSFANAGLIAPGHAYTWSSPRAPRILLKSLFDDSQALRFRPGLDPALWAWSWKFLKECTAEKARLNTRRKAILCLYSQERLRMVLDELALDCHGERGGLLYVYRSERSFERGVANTTVLREVGVKLEALSPRQAASIDPAFDAVRDRFAGAIHAPGDESGDAHVFTRGLAAACLAKGAKFIWGTTVRDFQSSGGRITGVVTSDGVLNADAVVLSLGVLSPLLARRLGLRLPIYPIKGYSVTFPRAGRNTTPRLGGVDEDNLVAWARFGDRFRLTATAEFAGYDRSHRPRDFTAMLRAGRNLFPEAADYERPTYWAGLRPMTPTGLPLLGPTGFSNLHLNTGHGHMGWTMSAGSARLVADLIGGRRPEIDLAGMTLRGDRDVMPAA